MKKHIGMVILASLVMLLLLAYTVTFAVDQTSDIVVLTTFGQASASDVYEGEGGAGWHLKWPYPIQRAVRFEKRRMRCYDPNDDVSTSDQQKLIVSSYCIWEISDPVKFLSNIKSEEAASKRITDLLRTSKKEIFFSCNMAEIVNTDPKLMQLTEIESKIQQRLTSLVNDEEYGVRIVGVGIERLTLTTAITEQVIETMKSEREQFVKAYETEGDAEATAIKSRAESARKRIIAFAERHARDIRAEGERAAAREYGKFEELPELSMFLRDLDTLRAGLKNNATIFLDGSKLPGIRWFHDGVSLPKGPHISLENYKEPEKQK